ncbi:MAG: hypothetical protein ACTTHU_01435 [Treponema sp.]
MYVNGASFTMNGSSCVTASTDNAKCNNDVYLANGKKITVDGALSPAGGIAAHITPSLYMAATQVLTGSAVTGGHGKFTVTPQDLGSGKTLTLQNLTLKNAKGQKGGDVLVLEATPPDAFSSSFTERKT